MSSRLEARFDRIWASINGPALVPEFRFHPERRWRFDRVFEVAKVAIELEGGVWSGGRHTRGKGFEGDCDKYNAACLLGWKVFRLTGGMLKPETLRPILAFLEIEAEVNGGIEF